MKKALIHFGSLIRKGRYIRRVSPKRYRRAEKRYLKTGGKKGYLAQYF
jgi:hypothetical protein